MPDAIDLNNLTKPVYCLGILEQRVIDLLGLNLREVEIRASVDKIRYTEKHRHEFCSDEEYKYHIEHLSDIIACPDYVGLHPKDDSIRYIKRINEIMVLAVRIRPYGFLWFRTAFPISNAKLEMYLRSGQVKRYR